MAGDIECIDQSAKRRATNKERKGIILSFAQSVAMPDGKFYLAAWAEKWEIKVQQHEKLAEIVKMYMVAAGENSVAVDPGIVIAQVDAELPASEEIYSIRPKVTAESNENKI